MKYQGDVLIFDKNGDLSKKFETGCLIMIYFPILNRLTLYRRGMNSQPYAAFVRIKSK
jgi:hypothetical protein